MVYEQKEVIGGYAYMNNTDDEMTRHMYEEKNVREIIESKTQRARAFDLVDRDDEWEAGRLLGE